MNREKNLTYKSTQGAKKVLHGFAYQLNILIVFILRAIKNNLKFHLATEMDAGEKFDDVVFEYSQENEMKKSYLFLQAKHRIKDQKKIDADYFLGLKENGDFCLKKYLYSFLNIKKNEKFKEISDKYFNIYTNIDFNRKALEDDGVFLEEFNLEILEKILSSKGSTYKLRFNEMNEKNKIFKYIKNVSFLFRVAKNLIEGSKEFLNYPEDILQFYQNSFVDEILQAESNVLKFPTKFILNLSELSTEAKNLREILKSNRDENNFQQILQVAQISIENVEFINSINPQIIEPEKFTKEFVMKIKSQNENKLIKIFLENESESFAENIKKLSGHILVKKSPQRNSPLKFRSNFFDERTLFRGNLEEFKNNLKRELDTLYLDLNQFEFQLELTTWQEKELKFKPEKIDFVPKDEEIKEFLENLIFAVNHPNETQLFDEIKKEIGFDLNLPAEEDLLASSFHKDIFDWFKSQKAIWLTEGNCLGNIERKINSLSISLSSKEYCNQLSNYKIEFQEKFKIVDINHFINTKEKNLLVIATCNIFLESLNVYYTINNLSDLEKRYLFLKFDELSKLREKNSLLSRNNNLILIIEIENSPENNSDLIKEFLAESQNKIIIITHKNKLWEIIPFLNQFSICDHTKDNNKLDAFSEFTLQNLLNKKINFLGSRFKMKYLIRDEKIRNKIDTETIVSLIKDPLKIKVGNKLKTCNDYYIERTFIWQNEEINENEILELPISRLVLISSKAGMGKSQVMKHLALKLNEKMKKIWVIQIDLNEHTNKLNQFLDESRISTPLLDLINLCNFSTPLEKDLFQHLIQTENNRIAIFLDAFDEISPRYENIIIQLIKEILKTYKIRKLFVSTRPYLREKLEKLFNTISFELKSFSFSEIQKFLIDYLKLEEENKFPLLDDFNQNLPIYIEKLDFLSTPLMLSLFARYFKKNNLHESIKNINSLKLYESFFEEKHKIYINDKAKTDASNNTLLNLFNEEKEMFLKFFEELALLTLFEEDELKKFAPHVIKSPKPPENILRMGIVSLDSEGNYNFIHQTFAEYMITLYVIRFVENFSSQSSEEILKFILLEIFPSNKYNIIVTFINDYLTDILRNLSNHDLLFRKAGTIIQGNIYNNVRLIFPNPKNSLKLLAKIFKSSGNFKILMEFLDIEENHFKIFLEFLSEEEMIEPLLQFARENGFNKAIHLLNDYTTLEERCQ